MLAALDSPPPALRRRRRWGAVAALGGLLMAGVLGVAICPGRPAQIDVSFITEPFEATIDWDGRRLLKPDGMPYTTPCTVPNLPAGVHRTVFRREGLADLDVGLIDYTVTREVTARWAPAKAPPRP